MVVVCLAVTFMILVLPLSKASNGSTPLAMGGTGADSSGETGGEGKLEVTVGLEEKAGGSVPVGAGGKVSVGVHPTITPKETVKRVRSRPTDQQAGAATATIASDGVGYDPYTPLQSHTTRGVPHSKSPATKAKTNTKTITSSTPSHMQVVPPELDFHERQICMQFSGSIVLINLSETDELHLSSIQADNINFYSLSQHQVIPPKGNATFVVFFLPVSLGYVESSLVVKTNIGSFFYQVRGRGIPNPFDVKPLTNAKIPSNMLYTRPIELYNPFPFPFVVEEVFVSGGFLQLSQPGARTGKPFRQTEVLPLERKRIVDLHFTNAHPGRYQGFIVVVISNGFQLKIFVEATVVKDGIICAPSQIDFGAVINPNTDSKMTELQLFNGSPDFVEVTEVLTNDQNVVIDFYPTVVPPYSSLFLAQVTFSGATEGKIKGKIQIRTKSPATINDVTYKAHVTFGSLKYNNEQTEFSNDVPLQNLVFTNTFNAPLTIYSVETRDPRLTIENFKKTSVLSGEIFNPIAIRFRPGAPGASSTAPDLKETISLDIYTNIQMFSIPLYVFYGRLHAKNIVLYNPNPTPVAVWSYTSSPQVEILLGPVLDHFGILREVSSKDILLPPRGMITLKVPHAAPTIVTIKTSHEKLEIPLKFGYEKGINFSPESLVFPDGFPGLVHNLSISAFAFTTEPLDKLKVTSSDPRIIPVLKQSILQPASNVTLLDVFFDSSVGFPPPETVESNLFLKKREFVSAWRRIEESGRDKIAASLTLITSAGVEYVIPVRARMKRPLVMSTTTVDFGRTQIYSSHGKLIRVTNPTDSVVFFQLLDPRQLRHSEYARNSKASSEKPFHLLSDSTQGFNVAPHSSEYIGPIFFYPTSLSKNKATFYLGNNLTIYETIVVSGEGASGTLVIDACLDTESLSPPELPSQKANELGKPDSQLLHFVNHVIFRVTNKGNIPLRVKAIGMDTPHPCYHVAGEGEFAREPSAAYLTECTPFLLEPEQSHNVTIRLSPRFFSRVAFSYHSLHVVTDQMVACYPLAHLTLADYDKSEGSEGGGCNRLSATPRTPASPDRESPTRDLAVFFSVLLILCSLLFIVVTKVIKSDRVLSISTSVEKDVPSSSVAHNPEPGQRLNVSSTKGKTKNNGKKKAESVRPSKSIEPIKNNKADKNIPKSSQPAYKGDLTEINSMHTQPSQPQEQKQPHVEIHIKETEPWQSNGNGKTGVEDIQALSDIPQAETTNTRAPLPEEFHASKSTLESKVKSKPRQCTKAAKSSPKNSPPKKANPTEEPTKPVATSKIRSSRKGPPPITSVQSTTKMIPSRVPTDMYQLHLQLPTKSFGFGIPLTSKIPEDQKLWAQQLQQNMKQPSTSKHDPSTQHRKVKQSMHSDDLLQSPLQPESLPKNPKQKPLQRPREAPVAQPPYKLKRTDNFFAQASQIEAKRAKKRLTLGDPNQNSKVPNKPDNIGHISARPTTQTPNQFWQDASQHEQDADFFSIYNGSNIPLTNIPRGAWRPLAGINETESLLPQDFLFPPSSQRPILPPSPSKGSRLPLFTNFSREPAPACILEEVHPNNHPFSPASGHPTTTTSTSASVSTDVSLGRKKLRYYPDPKK